jgi:nicotinamide-nucleotide amidase
LTDHPPAVEIVAAGNEVLLGDVLDTNTNWLCRQITALGGQVRRTVMIRDDIPTIAAEIAAAVGRRPALLFTVGGLGPTNDDMTLAGVAAGVDRPLDLHPEAERMVAEKYAAFAAHGFVPFAAMNDARRKMAILPRGARPLVNPIGGAPGMLLEIDDTTIVSLPGVPEELCAIVEQSMSDVLARIFDSARYAQRVLVVSLQDESAIADVLAAAELAHPLVYIKSRAVVMGPERMLRITLSARAADEAVVEALLATSEQDIAAGVGAAGYAVRRESSPE